MLINRYEYVVNPVSEVVIFGLTLVSDVCGLAVEEPDFLLFLFIPTIFMILMVFIVIITLRLFFFNGRCNKLNHIPTLNLPGKEHI